MTFWRVKLGNFWHQGRDIEGGKKWTDMIYSLEKADRRWERKRELGTIPQQFLLLVWIDRMYFGKGQTGGWAGPQLRGESRNKMNPLLAILSLRNLKDIHPIRVWALIPHTLDHSNAMNWVRFSLEYWFPLFYSCYQLLALFFKLLYNIPASE